MGVEPMKFAIFSRQFFWQCCGNNGRVGSHQIVHTIALAFSLKVPLYTQRSVPEIKIFETHHGAAFESRVSVLVGGDSGVPGRFQESRCSTPCWYSTVLTTTVLSLTATIISSRETISNSRFSSSTRNPSYVSSLNSNHSSVFT